MADEIEAKQKEYEKNVKELNEAEIERKKVDEQNNHDGDHDSPNEATSAEELEQWDEYIQHHVETILDLINWFNS